MKVTVAHSKMEQVRFRAKKSEWEILIVRADLSLQTTLADKSQGQQHPRGCKIRGSAGTFGKVGRRACYDK